MKQFGKQAGLYCLNRGWKFKEQDFSVLPEGRGHDSIYGYAKGGTKKGPAAASFDDSDWEAVTLPHDWVTRKDFTQSGAPNQGYKERGIGWYRMRFALEEADRDKQILLEFEGLSADAEIYVNGMLLKRSYYGYNSFCVDMTDMAHFGLLPNTIAVRIDASAWEGWWYEGAGIYRNVWLIKKSKVHLPYNGVYICPEKQEENLWQVRLEAELENSFEWAQTVTVKHLLTDMAGNKIAETQEDVTVNGFGREKNIQSVQVENPALWDTENPNLYQVKTSVLCDGEEVDYQMNHTGFRTIAINADTGFWLNGENIKLKGFCNHQDHAGVGVAVPYNVKEYRVRKLKDLGANAYRLAHNPDPEILEICDRLGMMAMEENRTFNSAPDTLEEVKGIVKNARNHPCVVLYSVFNEEPLQGTGKGRRIAGRLQAAVKEMDTTRPVLGAFNGGYMEEEGAATILEVVGINYSQGRYDDFHAKYPNTPFMGSETASAFMVRGEYQTRKEDNIIDDYDSEAAGWGDKVRDTWRQINERPFVAGSFVWTGFDYRGEPTPFTWPSVSTFFGTYDSCGFDKDACYLYRAFWKETPIVHIASPWTDSAQIGKTVKVMVHTNCEEVRLLVNGEVVAEQKADKYDQTTFEIVCQEGLLEAEGYNSGNCVAKDSQRTAGAAEELRLEACQPYLRSGGHDAAVINISLHDANGTVLPQADTLVQFDVQNGVIIGVGNGNPNSHEPDVAPYRKLFHGLAQLIVKPTGTEPIVIKAKADNAEAEISVPVELVEEIPYISTVEEKVLEGWKLYFKIFDEMPDAGIKTDKNDMNTFEPVNFAGHTQPELENKLNKYAMYRTNYVFNHAKGSHRLYFSYVEGYVWVYLDGELIAERTDAFGGRLFAELPENLSGEHEITVVVKNANPEYPYAGICNQVFYQEEA